MKKNSTGELKTRLAACEFVHASVILLTGTCSTRTEEYRQRFPFTHLYANIFPVILQLAVDLNPVIRQLFHQLLIQVHPSSHQSLFPPKCHSLAFYFP